jgi:hypothetical protein
LLASLKALPSAQRTVVIFGLVMVAVQLVPMIYFMDAADPDGLKVFGSFRASGWAASHGLNPYEPHAGTWIYDRGGVHVVDLNLNPPTWLPLFQVFAWLDPVLGARVWVVVSALLFVATAMAIVARTREMVPVWQVLWLFAGVAVWDTLLIGQIYMLLFAAATIAWFDLARGRSLVAGLAIGFVVATKPSFALWPAFLLLAGHWRPALIATAAAAAIAALPLVAYGPQVYGQWLSAVAADQHYLITADASLRGYFARVGLPSVGLVIAFALVAGLGAWTWRRRLPAREASALALVLAVLASPLSWVHYSLPLVPALLERPWNRPLAAAALLLCVPVILPLQALGGPPWLVATLGGIYPLAMVLVLVGLVPRVSVPKRPRCRSGDSHAGPGSNPAQKRYVRAEPAPLT